MLHVDNPRRYNRLPPVEKLLTLVFALVGKDRATWLRLDFRRDSPGVLMWYCVDGQPFEMVPPPTHLWPELVRIFWRSARLSRADRGPWWRRWRRIGFPASPVFGILPVRYGSAVAEFDILFFRGPGGEHIWMERQCKADLSDVSADFLRQRHRRPGESG
jgi:hypothetical protein